jgi:hypothetical protein
MIFQKKNIYKTEREKYMNYVDQKSTIAMCLLRNIFWIIIMLLKGANQVTCKSLYVLMKLCNHTHRFHSTQWPSLHPQWAPKAHEWINEWIEGMIYRYKFYFLQYALVCVCATCCHSKSPLKRRLRNFFLNCAIRRLYFLLL